MDGSKQKYRCYQASLEVARPSVLKSAWNNFDLLRDAETVEAMTDLIELSLPSRIYNKVRVHTGGDFYSLHYMLAWFEVARREPNRLFYAYTKSVHFWLQASNFKPDNFKLVASMDGEYDHLVDKHGLRRSIVVYSPEEAAAAGAPVDTDDSHAWDDSIPVFAHLIHGMQPKGSQAAAAKKDLKRRNIKFSYPSKPPCTHSQVRKPKNLI